MNNRSSPVPSVIYDRPGQFFPVDSTVYIARKSHELRSEHFVDLVEKNPSVEFYCLVGHKPAEIKLVNFRSNIHKTYKLKSQKDLASIWQELSPSKVYLDITGINHQEWVPLVQSLITNTVETEVVYVEPLRYRKTSPIAEGHQIFDLSEKINGISPLPGFVSLGRHGPKRLFIPLLGFEGTRVAYLLEQIQPLDDGIIPILGAPGFRPEHPFYSYQGNQSAFEATQAWQQVRFVEANCPFGLYIVLQEIRTAHPEHHLMIGLTGTKPHALGAVLFAIKERRFCELIYDHPVRKELRTTGCGRLLKYHVTDFLT